MGFGGCLVYSTLFSALSRCVWSFTIRLELSSSLQLIVTVAIPAGLYLYIEYPIDFAYPCGTT